MKKFLYSNHPTPQEFMNPALVTGLPPLRSASLDAAKAALLQEIERFLAGAGETYRRTHPIFGPMSYEEWHRAHYKHVHHHLLQFGVLQKD
jgi:oxepin-CoA hydrolase/3-oxo-5,6-dehydrosuberyl-CoA semialdehyde dehydrogenase